MARDPVALLPAWRLSRASGRHDGRQGGRELRGTRNSVNSRFLLTRCISYPLDVLFERVRRFIPFTPIHNATGAPAVVPPVALSDAGLPIGVQLAAGHGEDGPLLELARELEATGPLRRPSTRASVTRT